MDLSYSGIKPRVPFSSTAPNDINTWDHDACRPLKLNASKEKILRRPDEHQTTQI